MHSNKKMHHQQVESAIAIITGVVITSPPPSHHSVMACFLDNGLNGFSEETRFSLPGESHFSYP